MPMTDYMVRAMDARGNIRAFVATTTQLAEEARRRHDTWPVATAALGRLLTATALLSATLKDPNESITVRLAGNGPIGGLIADADEQGRVRGYVTHPHVELPLKNGKLDVGGAVGQGYVYVTRQLALEGIYTGTAEMISGEIGEDMAYYLTTSEQTPSAVGLGVRVNPDGSVAAAGGFLLQLMPGADDQVRDRLEANLQALGAVSRRVEEGMSPEAMLEVLLAGLEYRVLERRDLRFACRCSREKALDALITLDPAELEQMAAEDGGAELTCHFCGEVYRFTLEEVRQARTAG
jgi:molecular chaperone Hsp33